MGVPYIEANEEADSEIAELCKNKLVDYVSSEDMDILIFGSPRIIRNLSFSKKTPIEIDLNQVLEHLSITYEQFIELCILFGCDYCPNLSDVKHSIMFQIYCKLC